MRVAVAFPSQIVVVLLSTLTACGGTDNVANPAGGAASVGGSTGTGGLGTGGVGSVGGSSVASTGGNLSTGGSNSSSTPTTGGLTATGGRVSVGGTPATGGSTSRPTGGAATTGGENSQGGATGMGGTTGVGGATGAGGSQPKATGGTSFTGGGQGTGGTKSTMGGSAGTGGSIATVTGGASNAAGATSNGGAASFKCANLTFAPGTTGKAKPSGAAGGLKVLDWAGFTGAISWTFDDANATQVTDYAQLKATGVHATFFVVSSWVKSADIAFWKSVPNDGNEIGNHTQSHSSTASATDLQTAQSWIQTNLGVTAYTMAAPNGDASWATVASQVLLLNRGVGDGLASTRAYAATPNSSSNVAYNLPCFIPAKGAQSSAITAKVDEAKSANKWKTILVHGFNLNDSGTYQPVDIAQVTAAMSYTKTSGVWPENVMNVGAYWVGQTLIAASSTTSATWTLPAHFPPNMCVRISTTGGTVMQKGQEVPWDDHGYYQISLDAGSVTIQ